jgi:serine/arginine repetitive matrix protein 2
VSYKQYFGHCPRSNVYSWTGVISALDAATNELASLINRLDLEATPGTPRGSLRLSPSFTTLLAESPRLKNSPNEKGSSATLQMYPNVASLPSRRPCRQPQKREDVVNTQRFGQQIAPWPVHHRGPCRFRPLIFLRAFPPPLGTL